MVEPFSPPYWARNTHLQTIFASSHLRILGANPMQATAQLVIVPAGDGARLLGYHSRQSSQESRGQVILLHGWEGSADSAYMLSTGRFFYKRGYDVFRLNLRDHGDSHHLNRGLFHGALTDETEAAVRYICRLSPMRPNVLIGFSLGGNFALRLALRHADTPLTGLTRVYAISPAIDPHKSTLQIDQGLSLYRRYFLAKWKRSLRKKQQLFPDLYRFDDLMDRDSCLGLTEGILRYYREFSCLSDHFQRYTLNGAILTKVGLPTMIIAAQDDPVIGREDLKGLREGGHLQLSIQMHGGHCGFLDPFPWGCWYERAIAVQLENGVGRWV